MATTVEVSVPDIGDFSDIPVIEVLVKPGDRVDKDTTLVALESDKATMDVPSDIAGTVRELRVAVGDLVSQGSILALLEPDDTAPPAGPPMAEPDPEVAPASTAAPPAQTPAPAPNPPAPKTATNAATGRSSPTAALVAPTPPAGGKSHATPTIRRFARELGVDLSQVTGTGRKGRVLKEDVQQFVKLALSKPASTPGTGIPPIPTVDFAKFGQVESRPLSRIKRISGPRLHGAWLNLPMVTHHEEVDVTELEAFRQSLKAEAEKRGVRVTALAFLMKALVAALTEFPQFNASLDADGETLVLKQYFHIGVAMDTPNGLVVPVIRDVDQMWIWDLGAALADTSIRAREGKLKPTEMQGGCMSISSLGGIGGTAFTPIVNPPELAILGVTRSRMSPVWDGKEFQPRLMQPLDLTYDHRVIDGAEAARFMVFLCQALGDLRRLLL